MTTIKPIIKYASTLKRKLEDIDPIDEIEETKSMCFL